MVRFGPKPHQTLVQGTGEQEYSKGYRNRGKGGTGTRVQYRVQAHRGTIQYDTGWSSIVKEGGMEGERGGARPLLVSGR